MGNNCCQSRDRNDKVQGIETRNNMWFYPNSPLFVQTVSIKLNEISEDFKQNKFDLIHLSYLKWVSGQLIFYIEENQRNLFSEKKQKYSERIMIEIG